MPFSRYARRGSSYRRGGGYRRPFTRRRTSLRRSSMGSYRKGSVRGRPSVARTYKKTINHQMIHTKHIYDDTVTASLVDTALQASANDVKFGITFNIDQVDEYKTFKQVFGYYRINKVVIEFTPSVGQPTGVDPTMQATGAVVDFVPAMGVFASCITYDNGTAPSSPAYVRNGYKYKETPLWQKHTRVLTPASLGMAYEGVAATAYKPVWKQWYRSGDGVPHYGMQCVMYKRYGKVMPNFTVRTVYYVSWKNIALSGFSAMVGKNMSEIKEEIDEKKEKAIEDRDDLEISEAETVEADYDAWIETHAQESKERNEIRREKQKEKENKEQAISKGLESMALDKAPILVRTHGSTLGVPKRSLGLLAPLSRASSLASQQGKGTSTE